MPICSSGCNNNVVCSMLISLHYKFCNIEFGTCQNDHCVPLHSYGYNFGLKQSDQQYLWRLSKKKQYLWLGKWYHQVSQFQTLTSDHSIRDDFDRGLGKTGVVLSEVLIQYNTYSVMHKQLASSLVRRFVMYTYICVYIYVCISLYPVT